MTILVKAGCLTLVFEEPPWPGEICGRPTLIGGSSYRQIVPARVDPSAWNNDLLFPDKRFGVRLSHYDVEIPGYEAGRFALFALFEIENIDVLINGH